MEHIVNQIILTGNLAGAPRYSHENHGRRFYAFPLEVERLSGTTDTLPVLVPLELLEQTPAAGGDTLCVTGQIRSYNNREPIFIGLIFKLIFRLILSLFFVFCLRIFCRDHSLCFLFLLAVFLLIFFHF